LSQNFREGDGVGAQGKAKWGEEKEMEGRRRKREPKIWRYRDLCLGTEK